MTALPTSLRRTLLVLVAFGVTIFIMVFYWNQNTPRPTAMANTVLTPPSKAIKIGHPLPFEKSWTYRCSGDRCIREHYKGSKRIPFMSCAMVCGPTQIWPMPTGRISLSRHSLTFNTDQISIDVKSVFSEAKQLLIDAYEIFVHDIKQLSNQQNINAAAHTNSNFNNNNNNNNNKHESRTESVKFPGSSGGGSGSGEPVSSNKMHNCDINKVMITADIYAIPDIALHLDMNESYALNVTTHNQLVQVHIRAKSFFGARHALSTLQQLIWFDDEDNLWRILDNVHITDEPKFRYRGLMLDTARNYFSTETIKRMLTGMSHAKMNRFHWHLSDSQSFPYVSKAYPQLAKYGAYSEQEVYTAADIKSITEFARVRGIQVIPEIDAPAHIGSAWSFGPDYKLGDLGLCINQQPWNFYCGEPPCGQLNPKNNNTYLVLEKLYEELAELTDTTDVFHLGGDEVNLECWSQYFNDTDIHKLWCDFMLKAYQRLVKANKNRAPKHVMVWSSGLTSSQCLSRHSYTVQLWGASNWQENYDLIQNGFNIIISHVDAWYLDCGFGTWRSTGDAACSPYTPWSRAYRHRPWERMHLDSNKMKQVLGGEACLWTEQVAEGNVDSRIWPRTAAIAERLWSDPNDDHDSMAIPKELINRLSLFRNRLVNFGIQADPMGPKFCAQNQDECL